MDETGHIVPPNLESGFHEYDRVLRQNLALRRVHGPLDGDDGRPPTGATRAALTEENGRMRAALERRGIEPPRVTEGAVQPTTLLPRARRHVPVDDPKVCPNCGELRAGGVCRCGYVWAGHMHRGGATSRRVPKWDVALAWLGGIAGTLAALAWLLRPLLR